MPTPDDRPTEPHASDPTDRLFEDFEPAPLPPVATDPTRSFDAAPTTPLRVLPVSLCTLGPCANYHEITAQVDAMSPLDGSTGRVFVTVVRACYPHGGIEMQLTAPIRACNRWHPLTVLDSPSQVGLGESRSRAEAFQRQRVAVWKQFTDSWQGATITDDDKETDNGTR